MRGACHYHTADPGNIYPGDENVSMWSVRELPGTLLADQGLFTFLVYLSWSIPLQAFCRDENRWEYSSPVKIPLSQIQCWIHHCASRRRLCGLAFDFRQLLPLTYTVRVALLLFMWGEYTWNYFQRCFPKSCLFTDISVSLCHLTSQWAIEQVLWQPHVSWIRL